MRISTSRPLLVCKSMWTRGRLSFTGHLLDYGLDWHNRYGVPPGSIAENIAYLELDIESRRTNRVADVTLNVKVHWFAPSAAVWVSAKSSRTPSPPPHSPCRSISGARLSS